MNLLKIPKIAELTIIFFLKIFKFWEIAVVKTVVFLCGSVPTLVVPEQLWEYHQ